MQSKKEPAMILDMEFLKKDIKDRLMPNVLTPVPKRPKP
jgi:hypothetical protein